MKLLKKIAFISLLVTSSCIVASAASGTSWYANQTIKFTWYTGRDISVIILLALLKAMGNKTR